ncbi:MAG: hypothetical protein GWP59_00505 [Chlamydiales bacterium]|nr:hypothetical protein [Chlamydiales bacterium]NCF70157.1 hypothetical protein [Chlamydiales bacterium]
MSIQYYLPIESSERHCHCAESVHQHLQPSPAYSLESQSYNLCFLDQDFSVEQEATFIFNIKPTLEIDLDSIENIKKEHLKDFFKLEAIGKVRTVDYEKKLVYLEDGSRVDFKHLIVSQAESTSQNKEELTNSLTTLNEALRLRKAQRDLLNPDPNYSSSTPSNVTKGTNSPLSEVFESHIPGSSPFLPSLSFFVSDNPIHVVKP